MKCFALVSLAAISIVPDAGAISRSMANAIAMGVGATVGLGAYSVKQEDDYVHGRRPKPMRSFLVSGLIAGGITRFIASFYTPDYRYFWGTRKIDPIKHNALASVLITSDNLEDILETSGCYDGAAAIPLVNASQKLETFSNDLSYMKQQIDIALGDEPSGTELNLNIGYLRDEIVALQKTVGANKRIIKQNPGWNEALHAYNQQKAVTAQAGIAAAQQSNAKANWANVWMHLFRG